MPTVVGIRLRFSKTLWFDPAGTVPVEGDLVIVETERGSELGTVVQAPHEVTPEQLPAPLKPVVRIVDDEDRAHIAELEEMEREALPVFRELVAQYGLDMKPIDVEYLFGGDKVVFYFSAEERVDFRELVKDLAARFKARIDMRQVGVRDEARMVGGVGHCGQMLCCVRLGGEFQPVSIRMAKEQDLPLNPLKISGLCGRLMCCLRYEFDAYKDFKQRAPRKGAMIETPSGEAKVAELNTPRETVTLRLEDGSRVTVPLSEMSCGKGTGCPCKVSQEVLDEVTGAAAVVLPEPIIVPKLIESQPETPAPREGNGGGRRRRRRGGSKSPDSQEAPAKGSQPKPAKAKGEPKGGGAKPPAKKPAGEQPKASGAEGGSAEQPSAGRRRRRRRRPGGGGGTAS